MRCGGLALDEYMECRARGTLAFMKGGHNVRTDESHIAWGDKYTSNGCAPAVLMPHGRLWQEPEWRKAPKVFVMRRPVERVWSFYNYAARWFAPFRNNSIRVYLKNPMHLGRHQMWCKLELFNAMTYQLSSLPRAEHQEWQLSEAHFQEALWTLSAFAFVGNLTSVYAYVRGLSLWPKSSLSSCELPLKKPTKYRWGRLDQRTAQLIADANHWDMKLFEAFGA